MTDDALRPAAVKPLEGVGPSLDTRGWGATQRSEPAGLDVERLARAIRHYLGEDASLRAGHIAREYARSSESDR